MRTLNFIRLGLLLAAAGAWSVAGSSVATAEDKSEKAGEGAEFGALFDRLDADHDGQIQASEISAEKKEFFDRLLRTADTNKDGKLSRDEFVANMKKADDRSSEGGPGGGRFGGAAGRPEPGQLFQRLDKNSDGKITADEVPDAMSERFKKLVEAGDKNKDGALDKDEFLAAFEKVAFAGRAGGDSAMRERMARKPGVLEYKGKAPDVGAAMAILRALDTDGDGELSSSELANAAAALKKLDRNNDGRISREELREGLGAGGPSRGAAAERLRGGKPSDRAERKELAKGKGAELDSETFVDMMLKRRDKNGDGKISKDEASEQMQQRFEKIDTNGDGFLDRSELTQIAKRMAEFRARDGKKPESEK